MAKQKTATETAPTENEMEVLTHELARRLVVGVREKQNHAETLLAAAAEKGSLDYDTRQWLAVELGWDPKEQDRQFGRHQRIKRLQAVAGTAAEREALEASANEAASVYAAQAPKIHEEIARLQSSLYDMESRAQALTRRKEDSERALAQLSEWRQLPDHIQALLKSGNRSVSETINRRVLDLESEIRFRELLIDPTKFKMSDRDWLDALQRHDRELVVQGVNNGKEITKAVSSKWPELKAQWEKEMPGMHEQLAALKSELAEAEAELDKIRQMYWR